MIRNGSDPEGTRLPIKIDSTSNGEFAPIPLSPRNTQANKVAHEAATQAARRVGLHRRDFLISACGAASTLLAFNAVNASAGINSGFFDVPHEAAFDNQLAEATVGGDEFIFDIQSHYVDPRGGWSNQLPPFAKSFFTQIRKDCDLDNPLKCLGPMQYIKDVFLDSDTDVMVLSFGPYNADGEPVTIEAADEMRRIIDALDGTRRLLLHGRVKPTVPGDIDAMDELAHKWKVSAWKTYTQSPDSKGYFLTDDVGLSMIEKGRRLGIKTVCIHKGLPFGPDGYEYSRCSDIGKVAKQFPDVNFIVYHSGYIVGQPELAFDRTANRDGIDSLVRSVIDEGIAPNSNVYAELGSTWRFLMREPDSAAHALGKLFKYIGENNVVWGTDSIWYGSPQDQIQAFRTFQISGELRQRHGYPAMTPELRAKVFGLNAAVPYHLDPKAIRAASRSDRIEHARVAYQERLDPDFRTHGPKTRRDFFSFRHV